MITILKKKLRSNDKDEVSSKQRRPKPAIENLNVPAQQQIHPGTIIQQTKLGPRLLTPHAVLQMQHIIGNRAVSNKLMSEREQGIIQRTGSKSNHRKGPPTTCHEYVLWRVMQEDMHMSPQQATKALEKLRKAHAAPGMSIDAAWYGQNITNAGTQVTENTVRNGAVGDILVLPNLGNPMHTMLIEDQARDGTYVRGFNNFLTLYTGAYLQDDPTPRNLHGDLPGIVPDQQLPNGAKPNSYWKNDGEFWNGPLFLVDRGTFATKLGNQLANLGGGRKCYITTACVEARGLPDDCEELTVLRAFRDNYLLQKPNGKQLVEIYYKYSPRIVDTIAKQENTAGIYDHLYDVIRTCVEAIKKDDNEFAYTTYCEMVIKLKEQYIPNA